MGTGLRTMRALEETLGSGGGIASEPLVAGLATDPIASAEFSKGAGGMLGVEHKALAFVHGGRDSPGHRSILEAPTLRKVSPIR